MTENQNNDINSNSNQTSTPGSNSNLIVISIAIVIIAICGGIAYNSYQNSQRYISMNNMMTNMSQNSYATKMDKNKMNDSSMPGMDHSMMGNNNGNSTMNMTENVTDDKSFLENMIPHHIEAINSSRFVSIKTADPEIKEFVQAVINAQTTEINDMKSWYKTWFGKDYDSNTSTSMMTDMSRLSGKDLDKAYVQGMIIHHKGAVEMATKIQTITQRPEIKQLAKNIIESQTKEIAILENWLKTKFNTR